MRVIGDGVSTGFNSLALQTVDGVEALVIEFESKRLKLSMFREYASL